MDREYKHIMFGAMFDELDKLQADRLYTDGELQKEALDVGGIASSIGKGFKSLAKDPGAGLKSVKRNYAIGARGGVGPAAGAKPAPGFVGGVKRVLGTDEGKALAAGGLGVAGGLMGTGYVLGNQQ